MSNKSKIISLILAPLAILGLNLFLIFPVFKGDYTSYISSIESVFIAGSRFIYENFPHVSWNSQWYAGFSFHTFYTPVLAYLMALLHKIFSGISIPHIYRIIIGLTYVFIPVNLYYFVRYLTKKNSVAFLSALIYSLFPTFIIFVNNSVRSDSAFLNYAPWRLIVLMVYGEGPHVASLALIPLALLMFLYTLRNISFKNYLLSSLVVSFVALTNLIGLFSLSIIMLVLLFSEMMISDFGKKFKMFTKITITSFGLCAFWYNYSFLKASFSIASGGASGNIFENYAQFFPFLIILIPALVFGATHFFSKKPQMQTLFFASTSFLVFFIPIISWLNFEKMLLPQANRYIPELDMMTAILLSLGVGYLFKKIDFQGNILRKGLAYTFYLAVVSSVVFISLPFIKNSHKIIQPNSNIEATAEYKIAKWLEKNTNGERVYLTGSYAFWLNTFTNVPQLRGGNDGVANPWTAHATYQIYNGKDADISEMWAKAFNLGYIVVNYPDSKNAYKDFIYPSKFEGKLEERYNQDGDRIYKVPLKNPELAQLVDKEKFLNLKVPFNGIDKDNIKAYSDLVNDNATPITSFNRVNNDQMIIKANLENNKILSIQETYDAGWRVYINNKKIKTKKDVIGNMYIDPELSGEYEIKFVHGKAFNEKLGYLITIFTIILLSLYIYRLKNTENLENQNE